MLNLVIRWDQVKLGTNKQNQVKHQWWRKSFTHWHLFRVSEEGISPRRCWQCFGNSETPKFFSNKTF